MDRRDFLRAIALTGMATVVKPTGTLDVLAQTAGNSKNGAHPDLVAVMGGEPVEMFRKAMEEMGGMARFIRPGWKVVVKPNIGWDKTPEQAGNTNPDLVSEIVRQCFDAGAKEVMVFDHTCDDWHKTYAASGIEAAAKKAGAKVVPADLETYYKEIDLPQGKILKKAKVHNELLNADAWINVPILKHHGGANLTIAMKNLMGIVWDRGIFHREGLQQCIADMCTLDKKPVLNIVDAYRIVKDNGPRGKTLSDVVETKGLFMSQDIVAVDTAASRFFNQIREMPLESVGHLANGRDLHLGTMDLDSIDIKRIRI